MKKFKYRLQALLKVKEHIEKERQKELAVAIRRTHDLQDNLGQMDTKRDKTLGRQRTQMVGHLSVAEMLVCGRYLMQLKRQQLAGGELLKALTKTEEEKRLALVNASRERQIQQKLKERRQEQFAAEIKKLEAKETDEIALKSYQRKSR